MASMVFDEGDEEKDDAFDDPEIEMNIRDAGGARTRSSNVEGPVVANSGAEDFAGNPGPAGRVAGAPEFEGGHLVG